MSKEEEAQLKGLSKYFNSVTVTGRANVARATYACIAGLIIYMKMKPKKPGKVAVQPKPPINTNYKCN